MSNYESPMYVTLDELIAAVKPLATRLGYDVESGHPEDLVANIVPMLEAWADGFATGYRRGLRGRSSDSASRLSGVSEGDPVNWTQYLIQRLSESASTP